MVKEVFKNTAALPVNVDSSIQVTRPGGLINLDGQIIRAEDMSYEAMQTGKEYLLFLRFVPAASGYVISGSEGDFIVNNRLARSLSKTALPDGLSEIGTELLINEIQKAVASGCGKNILRGVN